MKEIYKKTNISNGQSIKVFDAQKKEIDFCIKDNTINISRSDVPKDCKYIEILDYTSFSEYNEDGYYVIADADGKGSRLCEFKRREKDENERVYHQRLLPFYGVKNSNGCYMYIAEKSAPLFNVVFGTTADGYYIGARFVLDGCAPYEDISLQKVELGDDGNYSKMAVVYRNYKLNKGDCVPLSEKMKNRPTVKYAAESPEIRIRMGWKPAPPKVLEQTEENEPEMLVACTFKRVSEFMDELKNAGVDSAQICLVGWNKSGHDGRYPQLFPVEEKLGGEEELKALIAHGKELGYNIVCHTNSTDCYSIADTFSEDIVVRKNDNSLSINPMGWSGGRMYDLCPKVAEDIANKELPKVAALGFEGLHYIDVISVVPLRWCHSTNHPSNPAETLNHYNNIMSMCHNLFGGFASEGVFDFTSKYLDYGLYVSWPAVEDEMLDVDIPLWSIIYHGIILANPTTDTVNFPIKDKENLLMMAEYGARPSFYIYSKFMVGGTQDDWLGKEDLILNTDDDMKFAAKMIKKGVDDLSDIDKLKTEYIVNHEINGDVRSITYSSGTKVVVDYKTMTFDIIK